MIFSKISVCRFVIRLLGSASLLLSTGIEAAAGWSANSMTINTLVAGDSSTTLQVTGNDNPMGCTSPNWLRIDSTDANYAFISASLLSSFAQGKPVRLWEYACNSDGSVKFLAAWIDK